MDLGDATHRLRYGMLPRTASRLRRLWVEATHRHCTVRFEGPVHLGHGFHLHIPDRGTLLVGPGVQFRRGFTCEISGTGRVTIGAGTIFTYDTLIQCSTTVDIGPKCMIAGHTLIVDGNHRFRDPDVPVIEQGYDFRPITIGEEALVMHGAVVVASIGRRSFIGANAVVTREIPDYALAVGAPARVVERYGPDHSATTDG